MLNQHINGEREIATTDARRHENLTGRAPSPLQERGWLLPCLLRTDALLWGRWEYLAGGFEGGALSAASLPQISFLTAPDPAAWKMLAAALDAIPQHGPAGWAGWSGPDYFRFFWSGCCTASRLGGHWDSTNAVAFAPDNDGSMTKTVISRAGSVSRAGRVEAVIACCLNNSGKSAAISVIARLRAPRTNRANTLTAQTAHR